jgi:alpha-ribazole phosphatase
MNIYLVRHPPPIGVDGICYGDSEVAVDERAIAVIAESIVAQISAETLAGARIYCSPSSRCLGLARRIASPREPTSAQDLIEMNFGHWQGLAWDAIAREQMDAWAQDLWNYRPGGGESAQMVAARWERWLQGVRQSRGGSVVAVTHAGIIRVALARAASHAGAALRQGAGSRQGGGLRHDPSALAAHIPFGSVHRLDLG